SRGERTRRGGGLRASGSSAPAVVQDAASGAIRRSRAYRIWEPEPCWLVRPRTSCGLNVAAKASGSASARPRVSDLARRSHQSSRRDACSHIRTSLPSSAAWPGSSRPLLRDDRCSRRPPAAVRWRISVSRRARRASFIRSGDPPSVFHDVSLKGAPELAPPAAVELPLGIETLDRGVRHVERVVRVVVREETLPSKGEQAV